MKFLYALSVGCTLGFFVAVFNNLHAMQKPKKVTTYPVYNSITHPEIYSDLRVEFGGKSLKDIPLKISNDWRSIEFGPLIMGYGDFYQYPFSVKIKGQTKQMFGVQIINLKNKMK